MFVVIIDVLNNGMIISLEDYFWCGVLPQKHGGS